jgi:hypothetical protein
MIRLQLKACLFEKVVQDNARMTFFFVVPFLSFGYIAFISSKRGTILKSWE